MQINKVKAKQTLCSSLKNYSNENKLEFHDILISSSYYHLELFHCIVWQIS